MADAAYHRAWRKAHPEYRARQNELRNKRRREQGRDRSAEYANRPSRAIPPIPELHTGHRLFELARRIVGPRKTSLVVLHDPLHEDLLSEAVLALLEGRDPHDAVVAYRSHEWAWGRIILPLADEK